MINGIENRIEGKKHGERLSLEQIRAIQLSRKIGGIIARDYPEIADDYRKDRGIKEIEAIYNFRERYGGSDIVTRNAIKNALKNLISKEEIKALWKMHLKKFGEIAGKKTYKEKKGIYAQSDDELKDNARKGGRKLYEMSLGVHGLSKEERKKFDEKRTLAAILARGQKPYSIEERAYIMELCENPKYQYVTGGNKGRPNYNLISEEIDKRFGIERSVIALTRLMYRSRKETR